MTPNAFILDKARRNPDGDRTKFTPTALQGFYQRAGVHFIAYFSLHRFLSLILIQFFKLVDPTLIYSKLCFNY